jgi:hypothetical protein
MIPKKFIACYSIAGKLSVVVYLRHSIEGNIKEYRAGIKLSNGVEI